jgi:hypothetical protein
VPEITEERWQILCRSVMNENDPKRRLELVQELNRELESLDKNKRTRQSRWREEASTERVRANLNSAAMAG